MSIWIPVAAIASLVPSSILTDRITLKTGETLEGTILDEKEAFYVLKGEFGIRIIQKEDVDRVERADPPETRYRRKVAGLGPQDAEGHFQLGLWCLEVGMPLEARDEFLKTIRMSPDHAEARRRLGYKGKPGAWYNPLLGEKPPKEAPVEKPPIVELPPEFTDPPRTNPNPSTPVDPDPRPAEPKKIGRAAPDPVDPPPPATGDWIRLVSKERVLDETPEESNLRARIITVLRYGSNPAFRVRPEDDKAACRWRIEIEVASASIGPVDFMGLSLTKRCEAKATLRIIDEKTNRVEVAFPEIREEYTFRDLQECARYALWKAEDTLIDAIRRHAFFRVKTPAPGRDAKP
ncbi:MAG: hypothetical protein JXP34_21855 [Planctomycetes bacterium]|nr:hypothetical protein [Planctomycetota bacterium]